MNKPTKIILGLLIVLLAGLSIWWQFYAYKDCRLVGHTKIYCVLRIGK